MVFFELYFIILIILIVPDDYYPVYAMPKPRCDFETKLACMSI